MSPRRSQSVTVLALALGAAFGAPQVWANSYKVTDTYIGNSFFTNFTHETIADPTFGRVNYVDVATAQKQNLSYASSDTFIMRADHTTWLSASGSGRNSVRISSIKEYHTSSVVVLDIRHMPQGCGTWPSFWTVGRENWPNGGEIDIIEGADNQNQNLVSLHTTETCTQPATGRTQTGSVSGTNCAVEPGNLGCSVKSEKTNSFGPNFNLNGGGWYAMERNTNGVNVWFWPRNSTTVPNDVHDKASNGTIVATNINPSTATWGVPLASFVNNGCDLNAKMAGHTIVFNIGLCGTWAGDQKVFSAAGCAGSCIDFVNTNPAAFKDAYFDIASLRVYT